MRSGYDKDLLVLLEQEILLGVVKTHEQTDYFIDEIESKFIMGFNGIDWERNKIIFSESFNGNPGDYLLELRNFLEKIGYFYSFLLNERVVVFGDGLTNLSYEMKFKDFITLYERFLSIPQHTYIWFLDSKKCINFTFENEMFFG